jgi:hypothetical protein
MPQRWDAAEYRKRAKAWREKASALCGPDHTLCLQLADGYERLAIQIEQLAAQRDGESPANDH